MLLSTFLLLSAACVLTSLGAPVTVVDLTHQLGERTLFWPGQPPFNFTILHRSFSPVWNTWLENNYLAFAEHGGTHIDSPSHFIQNRWRTHEIPASRLVGPGVIVDVKEKVKDNADYAVTVDDLREWEARFGRIPDGAVVIMNAGWSRYFPNPKLVFNTATPEDDKTFHFPGFHEDTARWLAEERSVVAVGTDAPTPDVAANVPAFPVHKILLAKDIVLLEFVANVDNLPPSGSTIVIGVLNTVNGSGGPARILGLVGADASGSARQGLPLSWILGVMAMTVLVI